MDLGSQKKRAFANAAIQLYNAKQRTEEHTLW